MWRGRFDFNVRRHCYRSTGIKAYGDNIFKRCKIIAIKAARRNVSEARKKFSISLELAKSYDIIQTFTP